MKYCGCFFSLKWSEFVFFYGTWIALGPSIFLHCRACSRVPIIRPYRRHCPLEGMSLLPEMNQIFTFSDSVLFQRNHEVLHSLTNGKQYCTAQSAFTIRSLHCLPGLPCL